MRDKDFIEMLTRLNSFMKEEAARSGAIYIDAQQSTFVASNFEDEGHFLPTGSHKFANNIASAVSQNCL